MSISNLNDIEWERVLMKSTEKVDSYKTKDLKYYIDLFKTRYPGVIAPSKDYRKKEDQIDVLINRFKPVHTGEKTIADVNKDILLNKDTSKNISIVTPRSGITNVAKGDTTPDRYQAPSAADRKQSREEDVNMLQSKQSQRVGVKRESVMVAPIPKNLPTPKQNKVPTSKQATLPIPKQTKLSTPKQTNLPAVSQSVLQPTKSTNIDNTTRTRKSEININNDKYVELPVKKVLRKIVNPKPIEPKPLNVTSSKNINQTKTKEDKNDLSSISLPERYLHFNKIESDLDFDDQLKRLSYPEIKLICNSVELSKRCKRFDKRHNSFWREKAEEDYPSYIRHDLDKKWNQIPFQDNKEKYLYLQKQYDCLPENDITIEECLKRLFILNPRELDENDLIKPIDNTIQDRIDNLMEKIENPINILTIAAKYGHIDIIDNVLDEYPKDISKYIIKEMLKVSKGTEFYDKILDIIAENEVYSEYVDIQLERREIEREQLIENYINPDIERVRTGRYTLDEKRYTYTVRELKKILNIYKIPYDINSVNKKYLVNLVRTDVLKLPTMEEELREAMEISVLRDDLLELLIARGYNNKRLEEQLEIEFDEEIQNRKSIMIDLKEPKEIKRGPNKGEMKPGLSGKKLIDEYEKIIDNTRSSWYDEIEQYKIKNRPKKFDEDFKLKIFTQELLSSEESLMGRNIKFRPSPSLLSESDGSQRSLRRKNYIIEQSLSRSLATSKSDSSEYVGSPEEIARQFLKENLEDKVQPYEINKYIEIYLGKNFIELEQYNEIYNLQNMDIEIFPYILLFLPNVKEIYLDNEIGPGKSSLNMIIEIPSMISNIGSLEILSIKYNRLNYVPDEIGYLHNLQILDLSGNYLEVIPDSISDLKNLVVLNLNTNKLRSIPSIPINKNDLTKLQTLNLANNNIKIIPPSLGNLRSLTTLDISRNNISKIPESLSDSKLKYLYLDNRYQPIIPSTLDKSIIYPPELRRKIITY